MKETKPVPPLADPIEVTVLFLDGGHASTAVGPLEVFRDAGVLWNELAGQPHAPRFRVRSASIDGAPVCPNSPYRIQPDDALAAALHSDLVFVSSGGLPIGEVIARNAPIVDFLRETHARGARVAGVCSGVSLLGAAGLLDGRAATTHWALVDECRTRFPRARWQPDDLVTEEDGVYCGGGVHAALDLALYLVDRLAAATPRASAPRRSCSTCRANARPASRCCPWARATTMRRCAAPSAGSRATAAKTCASTRSRASSA